MCPYDMDLPAKANKGITTEQKEKVVKSVRSNLAFF